MIFTVWRGGEEEEGITERLSSYVIGKLRKLETVTISAEDVIFSVEAPRL